MPTVNDIMDKIDTDLMKLIDANNNFSEYRKVSSSIGTGHDVSLRGVVGVQINPKNVIGLSIYSKD